MGETEADMKCTPAEQRKLAKSASTQIVRKLNRMQIIISISRNVNYRIPQVNVIQSLFENYQYFELVKVECYHFESIN